VLNYSTNLLESIIKTLRGIAVSIFIGWQNANQRSANRKIAADMLRFAQSDYRGYTVDSLARELDDKMGL